ncbi:basic membrane lipoprotein Med (substrate-binding protein (PBP1-ABC) superfamily) [Bradyrhizobium sp. LM6.11]
MRKSLLALAAGLLLAGSVSAASAADKLKVGFIYLGPIGDLGWTYQHELARQALVKELGDKIETTYLENVPEGPDAERAIEQLVRAGNKLIFTTSFGYMDPTLKVAKRYPNVHFEHSTGYKRNPNMSTYSAKWYQGRYIQGLIAAKMSKSGVLGYIGSFPIPEVVSGINATILAAQTINPNIKVKIIWANTWFDPGKEADAAKALIDQGADVIMQHTDSPAAMQIASERGKLAFGQDSEMIKFGPKTQLTSILDTWGSLLHRPRQGGTRRHLEIRGHLGRPRQPHVRDGALHQHARRREEDRRGCPGRDHRGQAASVQMPGRWAGRQAGRVQGRRKSRRRPDPRHEFLRQGHRRQAAGKVARFLHRLNHLLLPEEVRRGWPEAPGTCGRPLFYFRRDVIPPASSAPPNCGGG